MKNVFITGSFDLLHSGHVTFLKETSKFGKLYVGIGSDKSIGILKNRPTINSEQERLFMVKAIRYVEDAWINKGIGNFDFMEDFKEGFFDVFVVNEDQDFIEKREFCKRRNIKYIVLKRKQILGFPERSSTMQRKYYGK